MILKSLFYELGRLSSIVDISSRYGITYCSVTALVVHVMTDILIDREKLTVFDLMTGTDETVQSQPVTDTNDNNTEEVDNTLRDKLNKYKDHDEYADIAMPEVAVTLYFGEIV